MHRTHCVPFLVMWASPICLICWRWFAAFYNPFLSLWCCCMLHHTTAISLRNTNKIKTSCWQNVPIVLDIYNTKNVSKLVSVTQHLHKMVADIFPAQGQNHEDCCSELCVSYLDSAKLIRADCSRHKVIHLGHRTGWLGSYWLHNQCQLNHKPRKPLFPAKCSFQIKEPHNSTLFHNWVLSQNVHIDTLLWLNNA